MAKTKTALDAEFQYYLDHQEELVEKFNGKTIVIKNGEILGAYDDELAAFKETAKSHKPGSFLIQPCSHGNDDYTKKFHSRVIFA